MMKMNNMIHQNKEKNFVKINVFVKINGNDEYPLYILQVLKYLNCYF